MSLRFGVVRGDLQRLIFNHIITPLVFTDNSIPMHKFYNLCDGRSLRLSSSIPICIFF